MAADVMGPASIELHGSPDELIGTPEARGGGGVQVMHVDLTQDVLDELLACTRSGKPPQILFGRNPRLEAGDSVHRLGSAVEDHRHELYRYDTDVEEGEEQPWSFAGLVRHSLELRRVEEKTAELDEAVEDLKQRIATINERKEASQTIIATDLASSARPAKKSGHLRTPSLLSNFKPSSRPNSPSLSAVGSPALAPTSAPTDDYKIQMATRKAIIHFLAVRPQTADEIHRRTQCRRATVETVLQKVAKRTTPNDKGEDVWRLNDSAYKSLDLYSVKYPEADRKAAQDNAVRAYDRQRVPRTDNLWQLLLPPEDRGKGIVLSRLGDLSQGPRGGTPAVNAQKVDKKTGLPKKDPSKKERKEKRPDEADEKPIAAEDGSRAAARDKAGKDPARKPATKGHAAPSADDSQPRSNPRKAAAMSNGTSKSQVARRPTSPPHTSKPKNPSPLGSSPPTNASDLADNAGSSTRPPVKKRKADDGGSTASPANKVRKVEPSSQSTSNNTPSYSHTPSRGSIGSGQSTKRPVNNLNGTTHTTNSSGSGSSSPELQLSRRQTLDMAAKFKRYYERYEKLYHQLADNPLPPSQESRQELMKMHDRLSEMKREISVGSLRS